MNKYYITTWNDQYEEYHTLLEIPDNLNTDKDTVVSYCISSSSLKTLLEKIELPGYDEDGYDEDEQIETLKEVKPLKLNPSDFQVFTCEVSKRGTLIYIHHQNDDWGVKPIKLSFKDGKCIRVY